MAWGILGNPNAGDALTLGLLGLGGLGQVFAANQPRYSTNIADVSGPNTGATGWINQVGPQIAQLRTQALLRRRAETQDEYDRLRIDKERRDQAEAERRRQIDARLSARAAGLPGTNYLADPEIKRGVLERDPIAGITALQKRENELIKGGPGDVFLRRDEGGNLSPAFSVPPKSDEYSPGALSQRIEIARAGVQPLPGDTEAQRIRMAQATMPQPRLTTSDREKLQERGGTAKQFVELTDKFKDEFAGYKSAAIGDMAMSYKRYIGGDESGAASFWQQYQDQKNIIRNQLFGSALTVPERNEFDKAQIDPGMKPEVIRVNLARQKAAAKAAARKLAASYAADGYRPEAIEAALGFSMSELGADTTPNVLRFDANGNPL